MFIQVERTYKERSKSTHTPAHTHMHAPAASGAALEEEEEEDFVVLPSDCMAFFLERTPVLERKWWAAFMAVRGAHVPVEHTHIQGMMIKG
jgi:hypothetical protein